VSPALDTMFAMARAAQDKAYAPHSRFRVGAVVRATSGRLYAGANVENAAYPVGTCAEAGAIAAMVLGGESAIAEVLVIGDGPSLCTPCGACRQRLREFAPDTAPIHVAGPDGIRRSFTLGELLPHSFGPENLP
jgi:cytidine deaminase